MPNINKIRPWLRAIEGPGVGGSGGVKTPDPAPEATTTVDASGDAAGAGGEAKTPPAGDKGGGDEGAGSKAAVLADLARERDKRQALEARIAELEGKVTPPAEEKNTTADPDPLAELLAKITGLEEKVTGRDTAEWTEAAVKKFNIPAAMSGRITGTTEAEIQADAQALAQALGLGATDASQGRGGGRGHAVSMADAIAAHYTNNSN